MILKWQLLVRRNEFPRVYAIRRKEKNSHIQNIEWKFDVVCWLMSLTIWQLDSGQLSGDDFIEQLYRLFREHRVKYSIACVDNWTLDWYRGRLSDDILSKNYIDCFVNIEWNIRWRVLVRWQMNTWCRWWLADDG